MFLNIFSRLFLENFVHISGKGNSNQWEHEYILLIGPFWFYKDVEKKSSSFFYLAYIAFVFICACFSL